MILDGRNFGLKKDIVVMFAETEAEAMKQIDGMKIIRRTKYLTVEDEN